MNPQFAWDIFRDFGSTSSHSEEEEQAYVEACEYLIYGCCDSCEDPKRPVYSFPCDTDAEMAMYNLASFYCDKGLYELSLKYYEMTEAQEPGFASVDLGLHWYYGRTGTVDYEKAYNYFRQGADAYPMAQLMLAEMARNGLGVEKDERLYRQTVCTLHQKLRDPPSIWVPFPEVALRLALLLREEGVRSDPADVLLDAKLPLAERMLERHRPEDFELMCRSERLMEDFVLYMYEENDTDLYDLYVLMQDSDRTARFRCRGAVHTVTSRREGPDACPVSFDGQLFGSVEAFLFRARIDGVYLSELFYDLEDFTVL